MKTRWKNKITFSPLFAVCAENSHCAFALFLKTGSKKEGSKMDKNIKIKGLISGYTQTMIKILHAVSYIGP